MTARAWAALAIATLLAGCVGTPERRAPSAPSSSGPPAGSPSTQVPPPPADIAAIPDAVPRAEPRSPFGNPASYEVAGNRYDVLASATGYRERGVASWYGPTFHGKRTSSGEPYDMYAMTAAHKTLPLPCYARVTNLGNLRSVVVRINDRGPFVDNRLIDLSYTAAAKLGIIGTGTAFVEVEVLTPEAPGTLVAATVTAPAPPATAESSPAPPATAASTPAPSPPANERGLYVQVGAYSDPANAERMSARLRAAGLQPFISTASGGSSDSLRRVRLGPVADVNAFDTLLRRLEALGIRGARLALDTLVAPTSHQD